MQEPCFLYTVYEVSTYPCAAYTSMHLYTVCEDVFKQTLEENNRRDEPMSVERWLVARVIETSQHALCRQLPPGAVRVT